MEVLDIITVVLNILLILISSYLFFLYLKSKSFHLYPCYNIIILSFIIFIDNILRIIDTREFPKVFQYIQAILLTYLDKLLLTTITSQAFIYYLGVVKTDFYYKYEKTIFYLTLLITMLIDLIIIIILFSISFEITNYKEENGYDGNKYYYYKAEEGKHYKKIIDTAFNTVFLLINIICISLLLFYISHKKKQASLGLIEDLDYGYHYTKFGFMFIINSTLFVESYLIIFNKIAIENIDIIYLSTCLVVDLFYTINKIIIKETLKIFCTKIYNKKYGSDVNRESKMSVCEDEHYNTKNNSLLDD